MSSHITSFKSTRHLQLFTQRWVPVGKCSAVVFFFHGLQEHSGRYAHVAEALNAAGFAMFTMDFEGHGQSQGERGLYSIPDAVSDVLAYVDRVCDEPALKHLPVFLFGNSTGALIGLLAALQQPGRWAGVIVTAALVKIGDDIGAFKVAMAKLLSKIAPKLGVAALDVKLLNTDPKEVQKYVDDPLNSCAKIRASTGNSINTAIGQLQARLPHVTFPFLAFHGAADKICDPKGSQMLYDAAVSTDKSLKLWPGLFHEILHERNNTELIAEIVQWIGAHVPAQADVSVDVPTKDSLAEVDGVHVAAVTETAEVAL